MSDTSSIRSSVRSSSIFLNRPQLAPVGPRTRQSSLRVSTVNSYAGPSSSSAVAEAAPAVSPSTSQLPSPLSRSNSTSPKPLPSAPGLSPVQVKPLPSPISRTPSLSQAGTPLPSIASIASPLLEFGELPPLGSVRSRPTSSNPSAGPSSPIAPTQAPLPPLPEEDSKHCPAEEEEEESAPAYRSQDRYSMPPAFTEAVEAPAKITPAVQSIPKLVPPSAIKFDMTPVSWKSMTLEAALWTFNSRELQEIVSRAIRSSAQESFIRLLTVENLDIILPAELERLEAERTTIQARYRFLVYRRTMLFQALNSTSGSSPKPEENGAVPLVSKLTSQLAETISDCDQRLEEVLRINDQIAQVNKLIDIHSASALAVALRKLNGSYAKRTKELNTARERITQLTAELEEAWKEAEKVAQELDDYETALTADDTEVVIEKAEIVPVPTSVPTSPSSETGPRSSTTIPFLKRKLSAPLLATPTLVDVRSISSPPFRTISLPQSGHTSPIATSNFTFPPFPPPKPSQSHTSGYDSDAVSIKSTKSNKSTRSTRSTQTNKVLRASSVHSVHAARKRSLRASQGSLRLNLAAVHGHKPSAGSSQRSPFTEEAPPMPDLPIHLVHGAGVQSLKGGVSQEFGYRGPPSANASSTLLHFESSLNGHGRQTSASTTGSRLRPQDIIVPNASASASISAPLPSPVPTLRRQASMDTVCTVGKASVAAVDAYRGKPVDDIYLRMGGQGQRTPRTPVAFTPAGPYSSTNVPTDIPWDDGDIELVPRTPPYRAQTFAARTSVDSQIPPPPPPKDTGKGIPSMWMNVDAVKPSPQVERSSSLPRTTKTDGSSPNSVALSMAGSIPHSISEGSASAQSGTMSDTSSGLRRRSTTYDKLRGLTKRYSTSLPLFNAKMQKPGTRRSG